MTNLFDALEFCLREIEEGGNLETALARFPEYAEELRPILETSIKARAMTAPEPSPEAVRRSRARVMQRAAELRESQVVSRKNNRRVIPLFQRLALSFALTAIFLMSGSGLLSASASALPGERLYPVKRGWENLRLFFIFDTEARALLQHEFENERLHEANELLVEGRHEVIQFAGVFMQVNGVMYVSGLPVTLPADIPVPANGDAVVVSGRTNAQGFVEVISLELLPAGSVVPLGNPIEVETESDSGEDNSSSMGSSSGSGNEAGQAELKEYEVNGTLEAISTTSLVVNGMTVYLVGSKIDGELCIGMEVEVKGYYATDGKFIVNEAKGKSECSGGISSGSSDSINGNNDQSNSSGSSGNSNDDDNSNSEDDSGKHGGDENDNNSGSGGDDD